MDAGKNQSEAKIENSAMQNVAPDEYLKHVPKLSQLTDRFGNTFKFGNAGDYWHQAFPIGSDNNYRSHVKQIREMEIRDDDVLICSYPKTGLHWHMEIVSMLMDQSAEMHKDLLSRVCFLDLKPVDSFSNVKSPRLLVTHVPFRHIPRQALEKKIKIVCLDRNPKDVLVSYYNHVYKHVAPLNYTGTFEHFFYLSLEVGYLYGDIFDYAMEWQNGRDKYPDASFYISVFEDMKSDPVAGVRKLNTYLGTGCSEQLCDQIALVSCFLNVKTHRNLNTPAMFNALFVDNKNAIYRKGEVGDWKNWFTVAMNEEFDQEYKKRMADYRTVYKYTL